MENKQIQIESTKSQETTESDERENISINKSDTNSNSTQEEPKKNIDKDIINIESKEIDDEIQLQLKQQKEQEIRHRRSCMFKSNILLILVGLCHGLLAFIFLPSFIYQKEKLKLQPQVIQALGAVIIFPWCFKMLLGYLIDRTLQRFGQRKKLLLISYIFRSIIMILFAFLSPSVFFFVLIVVFINFTILFENIISEYTAVIETKKLSAIKESQNENQMPLFYGARAFGALVGTYFGGRALNVFTVQQCYIIYAVFPLILVILTFLYREEDPVTERTKFIDDVRNMKSFLFKKNILFFMLFVFLVNLTPNFDSVITFYLQDVLEFQTQDLADLSAFATLCYIIGLMLYYFVYKSWDPVKFFKRTLVFQLIANLLFLFVIFNIVKRLGMNNKFFCMFSQGAQALISELNFMPVLAIWTYNCPKNLEATSITVFTGFYHICQVFSGLFGAFLIWIWHVEKTDYTRLWILIVIQNIYLLIVIISLLFLKLPSVNSQKIVEKEKEDGEHNLSEAKILKANENFTVNTVEALQLNQILYSVIIMAQFSMVKTKRYIFDCKYFIIIHIIQIFTVYLLPIILIFSSKQSRLKRFLVFRL